MGLIQKLFGSQRQKTAYSLNDFVKFIQTGDLSNEALLEQYGKSLYVYAAINKIAQSLSSIDLKLFEILSSRGEVKEHASHEILDLFYRPNPYQTRSEFWKITTINKKLTGEAFWQKVRTGRGKPVELWNLRPDMMTVYTDPEKFIKGYTLRKLDGTEVAFEPEDIIHFKEPNPIYSVGSRQLNQRSHEYLRKTLLPNSKKISLPIMPDRMLCLFPKMN
jgi:HK97 family phage portal protein